MQFLKLDRSTSFRIDEVGLAPVLEVVLRGVRYHRPHGNPARGRPKYRSRVKRGRLRAPGRGNRSRSRKLNSPRWTRRRRATEVLCWRGTRRGGTAGSPRSPGFARREFTGHRQSLGSTQWGTAGRLRSTGTA
jgi:hypothetical protein